MIIPDKYDRDEVSNWREQMRREQRRLVVALAACSIASVVCFVYVLLNVGGWL